MPDYLIVSNPCQMIAQQKQDSLLSGKVDKGNKTKGRKKQATAERRSQRQMKEELPLLIHVLARFEEDNPHSRKVVVEKHE
eukprot:14715560-Ditylum_brightwellii.AAC.1